MITFGDLVTTAIPLIVSSDRNIARLWNLVAPDPTASPVVLRRHSKAIDAVRVRIGR
jgi:hypothetical protein